MRRSSARRGSPDRLSFDFIQSPTASARAIECNPRTHSAITLFYDHPDVAAAYLDDGAPGAAAEAAGRRTGSTTSSGGCCAARATGASRLRGAARARRDLRLVDPLPFLLVHHLQIPSLLLANLRHGTGWQKVDFNIGKLVEPGGD